MTKVVEQSNREELTQNIRNVAYAISGVLLMFDIIIPEDIVEPIVMGVIAVINLVTIVAAWWYSRRKFAVASARGGVQG